MIHHLTPYRTDKNIGKAYNDAIKSLICSPGDWIVIRDGDTMFLSPDWGKQIDEVAERTDFKLLGCVTNRLRSKAQLYGGKFENEIDIDENWRRTKELEENHWGEVEEIGAVAGCFMMFQVESWFEVGGFDERTIKTDMLFNQKIAKIGKIGIITGLYMVHCYRVWEKVQHRAMNSIKHLR